MEICPWTFKLFWENFYAPGWCISFKWSMLHNLLKRKFWKVKFFSHLQCDAIITSFHQRLILHSLSPSSIFISSAIHSVFFFFFSFPDVFAIWAESHDVFLYDVTHVASVLWSFSLLPIVIIFFFWRRHVSSSNLFSHLMRHVSFVLRHYAVFKKTSVSTSLFTSVSLLFFHGRQSNSIFAILLPFSPRDMPTENDCWGFFFVLFSKKNNQI